MITSPSPDQAAGKEAASENQNQENLANTKEKTPMCLINELARFNRVSNPSFVVIKKTVKVANKKPARGYNKKLVYI